MITKNRVKQYWDNEPCGTRNIPYPVGSLDYFETITERRDRLDPFIVQYAQFDKWKGKKVLEVGCGVGSDLLKFAQAGADVTGIDMSYRSVSLAQQRLKLYKQQGLVIEEDAESLSFMDNEFDFVYGWGSLHHTPDIDKAISEIYRVLKPNGKICAMLYHKPSLVALQMYAMFGLLKLKPMASIDDILATQHESIGTKAYTLDEVRQMFQSFEDVKIDTRVTSYDLRYWRDKYLPMWMGKFVPRRFGWNLIIRARKP